MDIKLFAVARHSGEGLLLLGVTIDPDLTLNDTACIIIPDHPLSSLHLNVKSSLSPSKMGSMSLYSGEARHYMPSSFDGM